MPHIYLIYFFEMFFTSRCVFSSKVAAPFHSLLLPPQCFFSIEELPTLRVTLFQEKLPNLRGTTLFIEKFPTLRNPNTSVLLFFMEELLTLRVALQTLISSSKISGNFLLQRPVNCQPCY